MECNYLDRMKRHTVFKRDNWRFTVTSDLDALLVLSFPNAYFLFFIILSRDCMSVDGVWIGNRIYCTLILDSTRLHSTN
jgi:hypothetical protein